MRILMMLVAEGTAVPFANFTTVCSNKSLCLRVCRPELPEVINRRRNYLLQDK